MVKVVDAVGEKLETHYCIPNYLRALQMRINCARFPSRLVNEPLKNEPIAIVCFGPSLNQTWEKIKDFKFVMSCSGAHKFLREKGIKPTYHVEVDPRIHKIQLIGNDISPETTFYMASCCHPQVLEHLVKHNGKIALWHTYAGEQGDDLPLTYPRGELFITGGADVGLRAFVIARILGFKDFHIFGKDGSFDPDTPLKHASFHPNICQDHILAEYKGKQYATTTAFLECARGVLHELEQLSDVKTTFYGEGLVQAMVKGETLNKKERSSIAFFMNPVISQKHLDNQQVMHLLDPTYGIRAQDYKNIVLELSEKIGAKSILDYGCGKGMLARSLDFPIWEYDPCVEGKNSPPRSADLVVCIDVLEHIEPQFLDEVLKDIRRCTKKIVMFIIGIGKAFKLMPNGDNSHYIQQDLNWWKAKLSEQFELGQTEALREGKELFSIAKPKEKIFKVKEGMVLEG